LEKLRISVRQNGKVIQRIPTPVRNRIVSGPRKSNRERDAWKCATCGALVSKSAVVSGQSTLEDGVLHCANCLDRQRNRVRSRRRAYAILAVTIVGVTGVAAVYPPAILGSLAMVALGVIAASAMGLGFEKRTRVIGAIGGGTVALFAAGAIAWYGTSETNKRADEHLQQLASSVRDLLNQDRIRDARRQIVALEQQARAESGQWASTKAEATVRTAHNDWEAYVGRRYGLATPVEHGVFEFLLQDDNAQSVRLLELHVDQLRLRLVIDHPTSAPPQKPTARTLLPLHPQAPSMKPPSGAMTGPNGPTGPAPFHKAPPPLQPAASDVMDPVEQQSHSLAASIFDRFPQLDSIEFTWRDHANGNRTVNVARPAERTQ
jgi:hypothetical protein